MNTDNDTNEEFQAWPKLARFNRGVVVTEKIDGTNAQILITDDGRIRAGSRTRWITPENDNFGFARWVEANRDQLLRLGPGRHFGEWWGQGIQRRYGLTEKRFSLFNTSRWTGSPDLPECCSVVPVLWHGNLLDLNLRQVLDDLRTSGSVAAPGWMTPEGIVLFHSRSGMMYKWTFDNNDEAKGG